MTSTNQPLVSPTKDPYTIRVTFLTADESTKQTEAVCYFHINDAGRANVYYSHEVFRSRALDSGPWEQEMAVRMPMNQAVELKMMEGVLRALWSYAVNPELQAMTVPIGMDPTGLGRFLP
jgi:hypothetical protein